jgi:hypothetical protein
MDLGTLEGRIAITHGAASALFGHAGPDLGPYDAVEARLRAVDTIILLDFSFIRCAWRALRRSRERSDSWLWLWRYRRQSRPILIQAINKLAPQADLHMLRNPKALKQFLAHIVRTS